MRTLLLAFVLVLSIGYAVSLECTTDPTCADSADGTVCQLGLTPKACGCTLDAHCAKNTFTPHCNTATSLCQCAADGDCLGAAVRHCHSTKKQCMCENDSHCANSPRGTKCDTTTGICGCSANGECGAFSFGSKCDTTNKVCTCTADGECASNNRGATCDTTNKYCTCADEAACAKSAFGSKCPTSGVKVCYCAAEGDCAGTSARGTQCNTNLKECVQCQKGATVVACTGSTCDCGGKTCNLPTMTCPAADPVTATTSAPLISISAGFLLLTILITQIVSI